MIAELLVGAILAAWLLLTMLVHLPGWREALRAVDVLCFVPEWRFFAPTPAQHDVHLLYQDELDNGDVTAWTEVRVAPARSPLTALLFNATKRGHKALIDAVGEFCRHLAVRDAPLPGTVAYLTFLNVVSRLPRLAPARRTRFMLMRTDAEAGVLYVSEFHAL